MSNFYKKLRSHLGSAIKGKFVNALLKAIAKGDEFNAENVIALKNNLFIATAEQSYLDRLMAKIGITRPAGVGIDDFSVRNLAISITNLKLVSNVFLQILEQFYGEDAVKPSVVNQLPELYTLEDGDDLFIKQDNNEVPLRVEFKASDFQNISSAKALEIATVISKSAKSAGYTLYAVPYLDTVSNQFYVAIYSGTLGPKASIAVVGGTAQRKLRFPELRPTTQNIGTQFTTSISGNRVRYTWTAGPDPGLQYVQVGDYVNFYSPPFPIEHKGSFEVLEVRPDAVGLAYFEVENPLVSSVGSYTLASISDIQFYYPRKFTLYDLTRFATLYEVSPYELVIFLPATSKIVKRELKGSWHIHDDSFDTSFLGSYLYDSKFGFPISNISTTLMQEIKAGQVYTVIKTDQFASLFPDEMGYLVFNYGTDQQEGPVRYLSKPSNQSLLIDASYVFKKSHPINSNITLLRDTKPYLPLTDGTDYPTYLTGTIKGRIEAERISKELAAAGIFLNIIIVYPKAPGWNSVSDVYADDIT